MDKEHRHLPLLVVQLPQGTEFPTRLCSKALSNVLVSSSRLGKGFWPEATSEVLIRSEVVGKGFVNRAETAD